MKTTILIAFLGVLACAASVNGAAAISQNRAQLNDAASIDLGTAIKLYYRALQSIMPCGMESMGIPVMAPLTIKEFNYNVDKEDNSIVSNFTNLYVSGLNLAEMIKFQYDESTGVIAYDFNFPALQLLGEYSLDAKLMLAGMAVQISGDGLLNMKLTDYRVVGQFTLTTNADNFLTVADVSMEVFIGDIQFHNWNQQWDIAVNNYYNEFMRNYMLLMVQELGPALTPLYNKYMLPTVNELLGTITPDQFANDLLVLTEQFDMVHCSAK